MITANSFKLVYPAGATEEEKRKFKTELDKSIAYLSQDKEALDLLTKAADSGVRIEFDNDLKNGFYQGEPEHKIVWNPSFSPKIVNSDPNGNKEEGYLSPAIFLLHEMVHSTDKNQQIQYIHPNDTERAQRCLQDKNMICTFPTDRYTLSMYDSKEEFAVEKERAIAKRLGEPSRYVYFDIPSYSDVLTGEMLPVHKMVSSSIMSERQYVENGKIYSEISNSHLKDSNGSIYTRTQNITNQNGGLEQSTEIKFNEKFKPISIKTTDYKKETITTENMKVSENGTPIQEKTVTDLNGMPISRVWGNAPAQPQVNPKEIDWNKISNKDLYAAILSGDTQSRAALSASFAQSDAGMALKARGAELYAEQQAEQRQQAFQRELEQMREQAEQRRQQEAEQQQSQSLSRSIRR